MGTHAKVHASTSHKPLGDHEEEAAAAAAAVTSCVHHEYTAATATTATIGSLQPAWRP